MTGTPGGLRIAMVHLSDFRLDSRIQRLAGALAERGDEVDLVCIGEPEELRVGAGVIRVHPVPGAKPSGGGIGYLAGYGRFLARAMWKVAALDLRRPFDLVEAHNMPDILTLAALGPKLRGTPVILNVHDTFPELFATMFSRSFDDPLVRLARWEERAGAALANRLITVTDEARQCLAARGVGVGRTVVVMNLPDEQVFGPARTPATLPPDGPIRLLYHGGLAPRFGVETLIRAFARLRETAPRVTVRICGPGEDRDRLARLAAEIAPAQIDIPARPIPFADIPREIMAADIGIVPTLSDRFTELLLPVKLLEYVHMGLPVVASRLPGIIGYFTESDLRTFTAGDPEELAVAIEAACADPTESRRRAFNAGNRLADLTWDRERERYLALVDGLARSPSSRRRPRHDARPLDAAFPV